MHSYIKKFENSAFCANTLRCELFPQKALSLMYDIVLVMAMKTKP